MSTGGFLASASPYRPLLPHPPFFWGVSRTGRSGLPIGRVVIILTLLGLGVFGGPPVIWVIVGLLAQALALVERGFAIFDKLRSRPHNTAATTAALADRSASTLTFKGMILDETGKYDEVREGLRVGRAVHTRLSCFSRGRVTAMRLLLLWLHLPIWATGCWVCDAAWTGGRVVELQPDAWLCMHACMPCP